MHRLLTICAITFATTLASCAINPANHLRALNDVCGNGDDDTRPWAYLAAPPDAAAAMREAARADIVYPGRRVREFWFSLPTGEFKLCRADPNLRNSCFSERFEFRPGPDGPEYDQSKSNSTICVS